MKILMYSESTRISVLEKRKVQAAEDENRQMDWGQMMKGLVFLAEKCGFDSIG